jgi:hypothetical protein
VPDSDAFLHVKNAGGSPDVVVIAVVAGDPIGLTIADVSVSVTNAQERMIGPLPAQFFGDPAAAGIGTITHGFQTSVTSGYFKLSSP